MAKWCKGVQEASQGCEEGMWGADGRDLAHIVEDLAIRSRLPSWEVRTHGRSAAGGTVGAGTWKNGPESQMGPVRRLMPGCMCETMRTRLGSWPWGQRESLAVATFLPSFHSAGIIHALDLSAVRTVAMRSPWNFPGLWLSSAPTGRYGSCCPSMKLGDAQGGLEEASLSITPSEEE